MGSILTAKDLVNTILQTPLGEACEEHKTLLEAWNATILGLKDSSGVFEGNTYGERLLSHCTIKDFKKGMLYISTDHPGWTQLLHFHSKYILEGLQMRLPKVVVTGLHLH